MTQRQFFIGQMGWNRCRSPRLTSDSKGLHWDWAADGGVGASSQYKQSFCVVIYHLSNMLLFCSLLSFFLSFFFFLSH